MNAGICNDLGPEVVVGKEGGRNTGLDRTGYERRQMMSGQTEWNWKEMLK